MGLLSFLRNDALSVDWAYDAHGTIWRVQLTKNGQIVGECRDKEKKSTSFFCLDEESGKPLWENLTLPEPWWVGIEGVVDDVLLLHSYAKPDMPEHKAILAYALHGCRPLWHNDDVTYWFAIDERVYAYRDFFEKRVGYELDLRSGECSRTFDESLAELHVLRQQQSEPETPPDVLLPDVLVEGSKEGDFLPLIDKTTKGRKIVGNIEFIREQDFLIFNYHVQSRNTEREHPTYENQLFVLGLPQGNRLFFDTIGRDLAIPVPDSFFFRNHRIFFLKHQRILSSLRLWK